MRASRLLLPSAVLGLMLVCGICPASARMVRVGLWPPERLPSSAEVTGSLRVARPAHLPRLARLQIRACGRGMAVAGVSARVDCLELTGSPFLLSVPGLTPVRVSGRLRLVRKGRGLQAVLTLPLEEYTARVVAREIPAGWPPQALAAQAVIVRSFAAASAGRHSRDGFDVCALTHCQLFSATPAPPPAVEAARRTEGLVLQARGTYAAAPFCSTCGGRTADGGPIGLASWCCSVADGPPGHEFCRASPHFHWKAHLSNAEIASVFGASVSAGSRLRVVRRDSGGRASQLCCAGASRALDGGEFLTRCGRLLGWARVKSCLINIRPGRDGVDVSGRGLGHGCGLCQWGARGRALAGQNWRQILRAYFPEASVVRMGEP